MNNQIIDISEDGASLLARGNLFVITTNKGEINIPFDRISVLILGNPMIRVTNATLSRIIQSKGMVIVCEQYLPVAMLMPVGTHSTVSRNYTLQTTARQTLKKQLWREIVRHKILFQSHLLDRLHLSNPIRTAHTMVKSGDSTNMEGYVARLYWEALFGPEFSRNREQPGINQFLNYGYTILHSCVARAICASGLHPSFGIYHHNQYNAYCLVNDFMEPFRPLVDEVVYTIFYREVPPTELSPPYKRRLTEILHAKVLLDGRWYTLFDALSMIFSSLLLSFEKRAMLLRLPQEIFEP